jgi:hypothetical protein
MGGAKSGNRFAGYSKNGFTMQVISLNKEQ